ncbi:ABC transporter permease [Bacillus kwashiorkori]|uniref:ABC transporter permease n=1 Tax=Bacillus kwashiorkori TaxID=1522318 RepID=UPI0007809EFD|nr:ABC transporter permease [Bacillus kwashiorkori]
MNLFFFELEKLLKRKTTYIAILLAMLALVAFYFLNYSAAIKIHRSNVAKLHKTVTEFPTIIDDLEEKWKVAEKNSDQEQLDTLQFQIEATKEVLKKNKVMLEGFSSEDWSKVYPIQVENLQLIFQNIDSTMNSPYWIQEQGGSWFTVRATLEERKLLNEINAESFIQADIQRPFIRTIYEKFSGSAVNEWKDMTVRYGVTGFQFLYQIFQSLFIPVIILFGCFVFGNNIALEAGKKRRGLNFYAVLPISKEKLFFAKYFAGLLLTFSFVLSMLLLPIVISLFTKGVGDLDYPILVYDGNPALETATTLNSLADSFHFINMGTYLLESVILTVLLIFFLYTFYYVVSLFFPNPTISFIIVGVVCILGIVVLPKSSFNPFIYLDTHQIINGAVATLHFNRDIAIQSGIISLIIFTFLTATIGFMKFRRGVVF